MQNRIYVSFITILVLVCSFQNCAPVGFSQISPSVDNVTGVPATVCDPFGTGVVQQGHGLQAAVHYLTQTQIAAQNTASQNNQTLPFQDVSDILNKGTGTLPNPILVGSLNVPDRYWTSGFIDANGAAVLATDGTAVTQYFGFHAVGQLVLGNLAPGDYEVSVISDDGSILTIENGSKNANGTYSNIVINNDGLHSAKMACTSQIIHLDQTTAYNLSLDYVQGPPVTIAFIMMLRPHTATYAADPECGNGGNSDTYFFKDNDGATPVALAISPPVEEQPFMNVVSRGWVPVVNANLLLPANTTVQGCN